MTPQYELGFEERLKILKNLCFMRPLTQTAASLDQSLRRTIVGVGEGVRERGVPTVEILVREQVDINCLTAYVKLAGLAGYPWNVRISGSAVACSRPAQGGDSISNRANPIGTLGCLTRKRDTGERLILSCCHVLCPSTAAPTPEDEIWHPGRSSSAHRIGVVIDGQPIVFSETADNVIDAAVCKPDSPAEAEEGIRGVGRLTGFEEDPQEGCSVRKCGATTGVTDGILSIRNLRIKIEYPNKGTAVFDKQYGVVVPGNQRFADRGDSGSILLNFRNAALGLLCATSGGREALAVANPIQEVLSHFGLDIV